MSPIRCLSFVFWVALFSCQSTAPEETLLYWKSGYYPVREEYVSEEKYAKSINILSETYKGIKSDSSRPYYIDHMNIATAFIMLGEPKASVINQLHLAQKKDLASTAELFLMVYNRDSFQDYLSDNEYDSLYNKFKVIVDSKEEVSLDLISYSENYCHNIDLVTVIADLGQKDKKYRSFGNEDFVRQSALDIENMLTIDSLYAQFDSYIGISLVGKELNHVMWAVIQHADLENQEKYLPIIHKAVRDNELPKAPLKMLIDRIYVRKYQYQIFDSQGSVDLASKSNIYSVKFNYDLL